LSVPALNRISMHIVTATKPQNASGKPRF